MAVSGLIGFPVSPRQALRPHSFPGQAWETGQKPGSAGLGWGGVGGLLQTPAVSTQPRLPPLQVLSPLAKGLFHRAISESGVVFTGHLTQKDMKAAARVSRRLSSAPGYLRGLCRGA